MCSLLSYPMPVEVLLRLPTLAHCPLQQLVQLVLLSHLTHQLVVAIAFVSSHQIQILLVATMALI